MLSWFELKCVPMPQAHRSDVSDAAYYETFEKEIGIYNSHYTTTMMGELGHRLYFAVSPDKNITLTIRNDPGDVQCLPQVG